MGATHEVADEDVHVASSLANVLCVLHDAATLRDVYSWFILFAKHKACVAACPAVVCAARATPTQSTEIGAHE